MIKLDADRLRKMVDIINMKFMGEFDHLDFIPMCDIDNILGFEKIIDIVKLTKKSSFDPDHAYFSWNSDGNLISFSDREMRTVLYSYSDVIERAYALTGDTQYL